MFYQISVNLDYRKYHRAKSNAAIARLAIHNSHHRNTFKKWKVFYVIIFNLEVLY